ncbi:hypothetical protein J5N97_021418 [Dioscorea zingiberensis]|uniref:Phytosulfokine n=1 Tax=Dioscorea zingiberensis TaxID=325984 RepID=A0A9D5HEB8_9LILI|nr:hypothetical protein J5N97_021418 [Dioscorea zingiberensis]
MKLLSFILVSVLILLAIHSTALNEGREEELKMMEEVSFSNVMGLNMEGCEHGDDEECMKRRMMYEAHLDYIYTQHHKP